MTPQYNCSLLAPDDIDLNDITYRLRPSSDLGSDQSLEQSIRNFGILHPPLLLKENGRHIVLSGRKRIGIARTFGLQQIPVFILDRATTSPLHKLQTLLSHALIGSILSSIEQAVLFAKADEELSQQEALSLLPLLGCKPHRYRLQEFATYLKLDPSTIHALHTGLLNPKTAHKLSKLSPQDQETTLGLIDYFKMGGSKQQKLVDYAIELTVRIGQDLEEIVGAWQQSDEEKENRPQQAALLLCRLEELCFPGRTSAEKKFNRLRRSVHLPENASLYHTPSFEDDRLTLSIVFDNQDAFRKGWDSIKNTL